MREALTGLDRYSLGELGAEAMACRLQQVRFTPLGFVWSSIKFKPRLLHLRIWFGFQVLVHEVEALGCLLLSRGLGRFSARSNVSFA